MIKAKSWTRVWKAADIYNLINNGQEYEKSVIGVEKTCN